MLKTTKPAKIHGVPAGTPRQGEGTRRDGRIRDWYEKTLRLARELRTEREAKRRKAAVAQQARDAKRRAAKVRERLRQTG